MSVSVWTDGACLGNGTGYPRAGWAIWFDDNDADNDLNRLYGKQTNQRAEMFAVIKALEACRDDLRYPLVVYTDSKYTIDCMYKWLKKWKSNDWTNALGNDVANQDLIKTLDFLMQERENSSWVCTLCGATNGGVTLEHVPAHSNNKGNEEADLMAKHAAQFYDEPYDQDAIIRECLDQYDD